MDQEIRSMVMFNKKGVSLITVLLFMLVATIAGTATFKWLTSENRSSASRMEMQEARQSAIAGIQTARAWMTNNGNEVGAVIRQYVCRNDPQCSADSRKAAPIPVNLNNRLEAITNGKQNFNVWLTGVNVVNGFYKLKILSEGIARNKAKHTEAAILNVSGLYLVDPPQEEEEIKNIPYDYAYFGGSMRNNGDITMSSMLINGKWTGNPVTIDKNLIITGNARLSGDRVYIKGTGCFGGDFNADNGVDADNIYIAGTAKKFGTRTGIGVIRHAYFDGLVEQDNNRAILVGGNMTVGNTLRTNMGNGSSNVTIDGNLCMEKEGSQIQIGAMQGSNFQYPSKFKVNGDVWITSHYSFYAKGGGTIANADFHENYDVINLGARTGSKVYITDAYPYSDYVKLRNDKTFTESADIRQNCSNPVDVGGGEKGCYNKNSNDPGRHDHQWDYWHGETHSVYVNVPKKDKMYYFYYVEPGITDVEFKITNDNVLRNKTSGAWSVPTEVGAYYVGGNQYYNPKGGTWNEYNYGNIPQKRSPYCWHNNGASNSFVPECHVTPWFTSNGTITRDLPSQRPIDCADSVKEVCDAIWEKTPGCDGAKYKVKDILKTAYDKFEPFSNKGCAKNIKEVNTSFVTKMNACYIENMTDEIKKRENLYNGYLVVKVQSKELVNNYGGELKGKFIIILEKKPQYDIALPATDGKNDFVFLYMSEGANRVQSIDYKTYNYFIYTPADIGKSTITEASDGVHIEGDGGFLFNHAQFNGSIYAVAKNCAKIATITLNKPGTMAFNQDLMNSLNQSRIICDASVGTCGGTVESSSSASPTSSASTEDIFKNKDKYFVSIAPQLNVTLESQYKTTEPVPSNTTNVSPSILVVPRIIYLTKDPKGTLSDYFTLMNLNGASEVKNSANVTCNGIPTTGALYADGEYLYNGNYACDYTSSTYGKVPFYVVVTNALGELPEINFTSTNTPLNLGESKTVSVEIGKASNTNGKIKFDFSIPDVYSGWTITPKPGVTARSGSVNGRRFFSVEVTPNATEKQIIDILTVETTADAADGDIQIFLTSPLELCKMGTNTAHHIYVMGRSYVNRGSLSDYCSRKDKEADSPFNGNQCEGTIYLEKKDYPDCDYNKEWVTVNGSGCSVLTENERWSCMTGNEISFETVDASSIPSDCEIIIPTEYNTITSPVGGEAKFLYASLKRKKIELTVNFKDAKNDLTKIRVYNQTTAEAPNICTKAESPCTYPITAGDHIIISHEDVDEDQQSFSNWSCIGDNCGASATSNNNEVEYNFYGSHTITAEYNKESHCYYEDFSNTTAFCEANGEDCIDTCTTVLVDNQACRPRNTKQFKSNWLMTYHNTGSGSKSGYLPPSLGSGSIFAPQKSDKPSIILRNKNAGPYGTMNALVQTTILSSSNTTDLLNSGLIFRSNGDEHLILNIYGASQSGSTSGKLTFRVCKVAGQSISNTTQGECKLVEKKTNITDISITSSDFIKMAFTIDVNDKLSVRATVNDVAWEGEVNVKDFGYNDITHTYVGFSLAEKGFKIYDNGWASSSFDDKCWEIPTVTCSFADKYIGETVPYDEDATPKVVMSSWFSEKNCTTEYHYNGCDNATSPTCADEAGTPGEMGAKLIGTSYRFTQEGIHGYSIGDDKKAKDASVKVVCPGDQTSLDLSQDHYSCGPFWVGDVYNCSSNIKVTDESKYMDANEPYEFSIANNDGYINMREAVLHVDVQVDGFGMGPSNGGLGNGATQQPLPNNANLIVQLQSTNGMKSLSRTISTAGKHEISVNVLADITGFDPQQVSKVIVFSDKNINIKKLKIESKCEKQFELDCSKITAEYNMQKNGWAIKTPPQNNTIKCTYTSSDGNMEPQENIIGCKDVVLTYKPGSFGFGYTWMAAPPTFTVTATDKNNVTIECPDITGAAYNMGLTPSCRVPKDKKKIKPGDPAPDFIFKGVEDPSAMIFDLVYKVSLDDEIVKEGNAKSNIEQTVHLGNDVTVGSGTHTYSVELCFNGMNCQTCSADFTVEDATKKDPKIKCNESKVENSGVFKVKIDNPDDVNYSYTFAVTDAQGVVFSGSDGSGNSKDLSYEYTPGRAGTYLYSVTIDSDEHSCTKELKVTSSLAVKCPKPKNNQDPSEIITVDASAENCEGCSYKIWDGNIEKDINSDFSFYDPGATGKKTYKFEAKDKYDNKAACNFDVTFKGHGSTNITLAYGGTWTKLNEGSYQITCGGRGGQLVCKCINAEWGYSHCQISYDGNTVDINPTQQGGQSVNLSGNLCRDGYTASVIVLPPLPRNPNNQETAKQQAKGIECKQDW